jgi:CRP-like cAMP-binding protein
LLLEDATWHQAHVPTRLTTAGQMPKALHFILEGKAEVERGGQRFDIGPHCFVGELAFLRGAPATATAHSKVGALYVSWDPEKLRALMNKNDEVSRAFSALLSGDLAEKIARSGPSSRA